jgi:beta-lactamase class A
MNLSLRLCAIVLLCITGGAVRGEEFAALKRAVLELESSLDARIGVLLRDTGTAREWSYRAGEPFLMNSTVKPLICAAALRASEDGALDLDDTIAIRVDDLIEHAPLSEQRLGERVSVAELCRAAVDLSDNTATNLLLRTLGGPAVVTRFLREIGDSRTRLDRMEPELNRWAEGDPRDTTTPEAIVTTLDALLLGNALTPASRRQLLAWMQPGSYTGAFLRATSPQDWLIADKSGAGTVTRTLIGLLQPPRQHPWLVAIFISEAEVDFATRNAAMARIAAAVIGVVAEASVSREPKRPGRDALSRL